MKQDTLGKFLEGRCDDSGKSERPSKEYGELWGTKQLFLRDTSVRTFSVELSRVIPRSHFHGRDIRISSVASHERLQVQILRSIHGEKVAWGVRGGNEGVMMIIIVTVLCHRPKINV